jgi:very-short-patch-repair endonuclease
MPGAKLLRDYLAFAERGPEALREELDSIGGDFESPFEESVADAIRALGYQPIPQIGVGGFRIDLGVVNPTAPGEFALGIECDGATYHSTPTARDRDRLRQQVLEDLGWRITRIWSRDWVRDRPAELARLKADIETAIREGRPTRRRPTTPVSEPALERQRDTIEVHDITSAEAAESLPWVTTYQRCELPALPSTIEFHDPALRPRLVGRLQTLIDVESPIAVGYAISRLAEAAGIARRGAAGSWTPACVPSAKPPDRASSSSAGTFSGCPDARSRRSEHPTAPTSAPDAASMRSPPRRSISPCNASAKPPERSTRTG